MAYGRGDYALKPRSRCGVCTPLSCICSHSICIHNNASVDDVWGDSGMWWQVVLINILPPHGAGENGAEIGRCDLQNAISARIIYLSELECEHIRGGYKRHNET